MSQKHDEIDLLELIADVIFVIKGSKKIILVFAILFGLYGGYEFFINTKAKYSYRKIYVVHSTLMANNVLVEIINSIGENIRVGAVPENFSYKNIKTISASIKSPEFIEVSIECFDSLQLDAVMKGVEQFVRSNNYVKGLSYKVENQNSRVLGVVNNLIEQIKDNQHLSTEFYKQNAAIIKKITEDKPEKWSYFELMKEKQKLEDNMLYSRDVEVIVDTNPVKKINLIVQNALKFIGYLVLGIFSGVFVGILVFIYKKATSLLIKTNR